jgi:hypothetical protein
MTWRRFSHQEIADALQAYGLKAESSVALAQGTFVEAYRVRANGTDWVARVRSPEAQSEDVSFAAAWGKAVKSEVPVPEPLTPVGEVPSLGHRVVDVAPYIDHGGGDGDAGPEAWIQIGRWVGQMHRLAMPLVDVAPRNLDYGNHPNNQLFGRYLAQAEI